MSVCVKIKNKKRRLCIGDLDRKIKVQARSIVPPASGSVDFNESFTQVLYVWALVQTTLGSQFFDGVSLPNPFTHKVYIRYRSSHVVTAEDWVEIDDVKYDIVDVEDLDERHEYLLLKCKKKGANTIAANFA